jgi:superfamily I DNA/RNA helicase|tara:strand:- start:389 stop:1414 length:1026 start_codon:yes stop_codon:yes gene_type:complete
MAYYFNLPLQNQLTMTQQAALDETDTIALKGGPGTGKSVVCLWRHIINHEIGSTKSLLLTYTKTLECYLKQSAGSHNAEAGASVNRTYMWLSRHASSQYDEIIVDEAQDVNSGKYIQLQKYCNQISFGADDDQGLYDNGCTYLELKSFFPDTEEYLLDQNFRNSKEILNFIRSVFPQIGISQHIINSAPSTNRKPMVKAVGWDESALINYIVDLINDLTGSTHNIGILVPGKNQINKYFPLIKERLDSEGVDCDFTMFESDMGEIDHIGNVHLATFKSSKGLEFDTVIIPNFDSFNWYLQNSRNTSEKDYYVALTRAKINLYLPCKKESVVGDQSTYEIME